MLTSVGFVTTCTLCNIHFDIDIMDDETFRFLKPYIADQALVCDQGGPR
jgi:hypothetical protein